MRNDARAVIIGSGICGSSIAYHLAGLGWKDIVVLEQGGLISGTTSHAPGLVGQLRSQATLTRLLMRSVELYRKLRLSGEPGYFEVGSLRLASSKERLEELKRQVSFARGVGLPAEILGPAETRQRFPHLNPEGVEGALFLPTDGSARAVVLAGALADGARERGVEFVSGAKVIGFEAPGGRMKAVLTTQGRIATETAVAATGIWTPGVARLLGVSVPLQPFQHQYSATEPLPELRGAPVLPNFRDPDLLIYLRQDGESLVLGGYEPDPAPFEVEAIPESANPTLRPFDAPRFERLRRAADKRVPLLKGRRWVKEMNGLESFTPDGDFILGESAEVRGFWVACGFCAHGVSGSGGVGSAMAEWIDAGEPPLDLWHMDVRRFAPHTRSRRYVRERSSEVYRTYYHISYPGAERESERGLRQSPLYARLRNLGAAFGEKAGWERPNWFAANEAEGRRLIIERGLPEPRGWARRLWSPAVAAEHVATRERVGLFDETSFAKIEVSGKGALPFLERLCGNKMDRPIGAITYTQLLNRRGGIECDLTVTRLGPNRFRLVTGTAFGVHDLAWIRSHLPDDGSVEARDVTSSLACIGVWGPLARELVASLAEEDLSNGAFPFFTAQEVMLAGVPAFAARVTYVGELGWELYPAMDSAGRLWDSLLEAGKAHGARACGYRAIDSLRLEKGYRYWSCELDSERNPLEAGLAFAVKLEKGDFIGRDALRKLKETGLRQKLSCLVLDDPRAAVLGGEPVLKEGRLLGRVTSGGIGFTVKKSIAYAYLPIEESKPGTRLEVELFQERIGAAVTEEPLWDPKGERIRA